MKDLKYLTYVDVLKIFLSFKDIKKENKTKTATQKDIDRLLG